MRFIVYSVCILASRANFTLRKPRDRKTFTRMVREKVRPQ